MQGPRDKQMYQGIFMQYVPVATDTHTTIEVLLEILCLLVPYKVDIRSTTEARII
jgi:hypothetical protein